MSWITLTPQLNNKEKRGDQTRVSVFPTSLVIRIGREVQGELQWPIGSTVRVLYGTDKDAGKLRLEIGEPGWMLSEVRRRGNATGTSRIKIAKHSFRNGQLSDVPERMESAEVMPLINAGGIEFVVPWHQPEAELTLPPVSTNKAPDKPADNNRPLTQRFKRAKLRQPGKPPATAETVEEAIARGVKITKIPPVLTDDNGERGVPVRSSLSRSQGITGVIG
jgi:hypothetical protein